MIAPTAVGSKGCSGLVDETLREGRDQPVHLVDGWVQDHEVAKQRVGERRQGPGDRRGDPVAIIDVEIARLEMKSGHDARSKLERPGPGGSVLGLEVRIAAANEDDGCVVS